ATGVKNQCTTSGGEVESCDQSVKTRCKLTCLLGKRSPAWAILLAWGLVRPNEIAPVAIQQKHAGNSLSFGAAVLSHWRSHASLRTTSSTCNEDAGWTSNQTARSALS